MICEMIISKKYFCVINDIPNSIQENTKLLNKLYSRESNYAAVLYSSKSKLAAALNMGKSKFAAALYSNSQNCPLNNKRVGQFAQLCFTVVSQKYFGT